MAATNIAGLNGTLANCGSNQPGVVGRGDNQSLAYFRNLLEANQDAAVTSHMNYVNGLTASYGVSAVQNGTNTVTTDAVIFDSNYTNFCGLSWTTTGDAGSGTFGLTSCISHNGVGECEKNEVRVTTIVGGLTDTANERQRIMCHEIGHAFGLLHRDTNPQEGCMPTATSQMVGPNYTAHDKNHLEFDLS